MSKCNLMSIAGYAVSDYLHTQHPRTQDDIALTNWLLAVRNGLKARDEEIARLKADRDRWDAVEKNFWTLIVYKDGRTAVCTFNATTEGHYWGSSPRSAVDTAVKAQNEKTGAKS